MDEQATYSNGSTASERNDGTVNGIRIFPPLLALLCLAGGLVLHLMSRGQHLVWPHHVLGLLIIAAGVGLSFYSAAIFDARDTTKNPYGEPDKMVTMMPYTFTRNPMYLGLTIVLIGFSVFFNSAVMFLAPIAFFAIIDRVLIPREEEAMERIFGAAYVDYKTRVRRWL